MQVILFMLCAFKFLLGACIAVCGFFGLPAIGIYAPVAPDTLIGWSGIGHMALSFVWYFTRRNLWIAH